MIVVDTGPLVAALNAADVEHESCTALLRSQPGALIVPTPVLTEVCWVLASAGGPGSEAAFLDSVAAGELDLIAPTLPDVQRMAQLVREYADIPLNAVDACVVAVAERLGISQLATLDRAKFTLVRPAHRPAFTLLPQDFTP